MQQPAFERQYELRYLIARDAISSMYTVRRLKDRKLFLARTFDLQALNPDDRARADEETSLAQRVSHPNILQYRELRFSASNEIMSVIMRYEQLTSLDKIFADCVAKRLQIEERQVWSMIADLLDATLYVLRLEFDGSSENGIEFANFTPKNVFLTPDGRIRLKSLRHRVSNSALLHAAGTPYSTLESMAQQSININTRSLQSMQSMQSIRRGDTRSLAVEQSLPIPDNVYTNVYNTIDMQAQNTMRAIHAVAQRPVYANPLEEYYKCQVPGYYLYELERQLLYSIGLFLYEMCTFKRYNYKTVEGVRPRIPAMEIVLPGYSLAIQETCRHLLDVESAVTALDLMSLPEIRDVHPIIAANFSTGRQDELISAMLASINNGTVDPAKSELTSLKNESREESTLFAHIPERTLTMTSISRAASARGSFSMPSRFVRGRPSSAADPSLLISAEPTGRVDSLYVRPIDAMCEPDVTPGEEYFSQCPHLRRPVLRQVTEKTPLMIAVEQGDIASAKEHLSAYGGCMLEDGTCALHIAINRFYFAIADLLVPFEGVYIDDEEHLTASVLRQMTPPLPNGRTPLMEAIIQGDMAAAYSLRNIYATMQDDDGLTALMHGVLHRCGAMVRVLAPLETGYVDKNGCCAAYYACQMGLRTDLPVLIERERNLLKSSGFTPLMMAAAVDDSMTVASLCKKHCTMQDTHGLTALMVAAICATPETILKIAPFEAGMHDSMGKTALMYAILGKNEANALALVDFETFNVDSEGRTALMYCAMVSFPPLVGPLLPSEARQVDYAGSSALMLAIEHKSIGVASLLADVEGGIQNNQGETALMMALHNGIDNIVNQLLTAEAGRVSKTGNLATLEALHAGKAVVCSKLAVIEHELLAKQGFTPLMMTVLKFETDFNKHLSDVGKQTEDGLTALMMAIMLNNTVAISALTEYEQDIADTQGRHASDYAPRSRSATPVLTTALTAGASMTSRSTNATPTELLKASRPQLRSMTRSSILEQEPPSVSSTPQFQTRSTTPGLRPVSSAVRSQARMTTRPPRSASATITPEMKRTAYDSYRRISLDEGSEGSVESNPRNSLMLAVLSGDVQRCKQNIHLTRQVFGHTNKTALIISADRGFLDCAILLADKEAGLQTTTGWTALMRAVVRRHCEICAVLASKECKLRNHRGATALMLAAELGLDPVVAILAPYEGGLRRNDEYTALMLAAKRGYAGVCQLLVHYEARMARKDGITALMYAVQNQHLDIVRILSERECVMQLENGWTAAMMAARLGFSAALPLLPTEFCMQNENGSTALMLAAQSNHIDAARYLVSHESRIKNKQGATALMLAAESGYDEVCRLLIPQEAGLRTNGGSTALMFAAQLGHLECVRLLMTAEAGIQRPDGTTALMLAAQDGKNEVIELLVKVEAGFQDDFGGTALMRAARQGNQKGVTYLLEERDLQRQDGQTAYDIAMAHGHERCAALLRK